MHSVIRDSGRLLLDLQSTAVRLSIPADKSFQNWLIRTVQPTNSLQTNVLFLTNQSSQIEGFLFMIHPYPLWVRWNPRTKCIFFSRVFWNHITSFTIGSSRIFMFAAHEAVSTLCWHFLRNRSISLSLSPSSICLFQTTFWEHRWIRLFAVALFLSSNAMCLLQNYVDSSNM